MHKSISTLVLMSSMTVVKASQAPDLGTIAAKASDTTHLTVAAIAAGSSSAGSISSQSSKSNEEMVPPLRRTHRLTPVEAGILKKLYAPVELHKLPEKVSLSFCLQIGDTKYTISSEGNAKLWQITRDNRLLTAISIEQQNNSDLRNLTPHDAKEISIPLDHNVSISGFEVKLPNAIRNDNNLYFLQGRSFSMTALSMKGTATLIQGILSIGMLLMGEIPMPSEQSDAHQAAINFL